MYEKFKKELLCNVMQREEARDKVIRLLEPKMICADPESIRLIRLINFATYGKEDLIIREDMLCISWGQGGLVNMKYWKVQILYMHFLKEGWQSVLPQIVLTLQEAGAGAEKDPVWEGCYEQSRYCHIIRPLNCNYHRQELENCIYWRYGDIALVLAVIVYESKEDCMTMKLNRGMTEKWGLADQVLLTNALLNTRALMPPRLFHGDDLRLGCSSKKGIFMPDDGRPNIFVNIQDELEGIRGYRLTTTRWINGAVALFYPYVKERLSEMLGGDFFVGFTSVHEAVLHPVRHKILSEMKAAIQHTNAVFDESEMLTNRIYRYCRAKGTLVEV